MNNIINTLFLGIILTCLTYSTSNAALFRTAFNYQGELRINNQLANGVFDFAITPHANPNGNDPGLSNSEFFNNVTVTNGLFNLPDVTFPAAIYENNDKIWLTIHIKQPNEVDYTDLTPSQQLSTVPYSVFSKTSEDSIFSEFSQVSSIADKLAAGNANQGDVLQFDQGQWKPKIPPQSLWSNPVGDIINRLNGKVGIGVNGANSRLHVNSNLNETPFRVQINGITKFIVQKSGKIGMGEFNPDSHLHIKSDANESPLKIVSGNTQRLNMTNDNKTFIADHVFLNDTDISGQANFNNITTFNSNTQQFINADGQLKYTLKVNCINAGNASIEKQYNGTSQGLVTVTPDGLGQCSLHFPTNISQRYWITSLYDATVAAMVSCKYAAINDSLQCDVRKGSDNSFVSGHFTIVVY